MALQPDALEVRCSGEDNLRRKGRVGRAAGSPDIHHIDRFDAAEVARLRLSPCRELPILEHLGDTTTPRPALSTRCPNDVSGTSLSLSAPWLFCEEDWVVVSSVACSTLQARRSADVSAQWYHRHLR